MHDTKKLPFEERVADVHQLGFTCGHLALSKVIDEFPVTDEALTPGLAMYMKSVFARHQVDVAVLGCYLNLATPSREQLEKNVRRYMAHLRFASVLGCGVVGTETGAPNETYTFTPACHTQEALKTFIRNLRPVVRYAEQMGTVLAIEPVYRHIVSNPKRARRVLEEIASPNLQIIFDPVNLLGMENYQDREAVFGEAIELLGADIAVVHLKDFVVREGKIVSTACGLGEMDYTPILRFIRERKPYIHATLEDTRPENSAQARDFIWKQYESLSR